MQATITADEVSQGLKTIMSFTLPNAASGKVEGHFAHENAGVAGAVGLTASPEVDVTAAFGNREYALGGAVSFDTASGSLKKYEAGISINKWDSAALILADKGDSLKASYSHTVNPLTKATVGAEAVHSISKNLNTFTVGGSMLNLLPGPKLELGSSPGPMKKATGPASGSSSKGTGEMKVAVGGSGQMPEKGKGLALPDTELHLLPGPKLRASPSASTGTTMLKIIYVELSLNWEVPQRLLNSKVEAVLESRLFKQEVNDWLVGHGLHENVGVDAFIFPSSGINLPMNQFVREDGFIAVTPNANGRTHRGLFHRQAKEASEMKESLVKMWNDAADHKKKMQEEDRRRAGGEDDGSLAGEIASLKTIISNIRDENNKMQVKHEADVAAGNKSLKDLDSMQSILRGELAQHATRIRILEDEIRATGALYKRRLLEGYRKSVVDHLQADPGRPQPVLNPLTGAPNAEWWNGFISNAGNWELLSSLAASRGVSLDPETLASTSFGRDTLQCNLSREVHAITGDPSIYALLICRTREGGLRQRMLKLYTMVFGRDAEVDAFDTQVEKDGLGDGEHEQQREEELPEEIGVEIPVEGSGEQAEEAGPARG